MQVLISGGLGYIGSHTVIELLEANHKVVIADNLYNSKIESIKKIELITNRKIDFNKIDVTNIEDVTKLFSENSFDAVIHFAGYKAVEESLRKPLTYYRNNLLSTIVLASVAIEHNVSKFIFSSSATVYGNQVSPLIETMKLNPTTNPYGESKAMSEKILIDTAKANHGFNVTILRYFNPVGAHKSGLIGDDPIGVPNNLLPYISKVAKGNLKELNIYGDDYETVDGTGVRDYLHVVDLAKGHLAALNKMKSGVNIYNLGTGRGISVLEIVNAFERVNQVKIPYKIIERRPGDLASVYADVSKAKRDLNWEAKLTIDEMVRDAWNYELNN